ncbi:hypothetical protein IQ273_30905 [Nodosilinea sp. LEGE 07298]|uniref:hypothetical protein n=1 Tax=Nodosilinea sp. LEGE 07298 TaxID=2777970 RepID=UPI0018806620|nr:hypothetical protein [Nodosilinea sp. LEGE 07298]MBE9113783.1 hypothetical protein [Nodosilinea sp. LEGE 07298]
MLEPTAMEEDYYVEPVERQLCPYIDLIELEEAIKLYYQGKLNDVDEEYFARLYLENYQLIPGKTLLSVLDQATMWECLYKLDFIHRCTLNAYYGDSAVANVRLSKVVPPGMRLSDYQSFLLPHAINALAYIVHQML